MATLREELQAKIMAAQAEADSARKDLADLENGLVSILDQDKEAIKLWVQSILKHIGL